MIGLMAGLGVGLGLVIAASAFGPRASLASLWGRDGEFGRAADFVGLGADRNWFDAAVARLMGRSEIDDLMVGTGFDQNLAVVGSDRVGFAAASLLKALAAGAVTVAIGMTAPESFPIGADARLVLFALGAAGTTMASDARRLQARARRRRGEMLEAVSAFMEFTKVAAQTQSVEGAMRAGVQMGATWPFRVIERVFAQADARGEAPWRGLARLGRTYGMVELIELGGALENAGTEGSRVGAMLSAKAQSLRRKATEAEVAVAKSRTQQMTFPLSVIGLVAVVLLMTPAVMAL